MFSNIFFIFCVYMSISTNYFSVYMSVLIYIYTHTHIYTHIYIMGLFFSPLRMSFGHLHCQYLEIQMSFFFNDCIYSTLWLCNGLTALRMDSCCSNVSVTNTTITQRCGPVFPNTTANEFIEIK